MRQFNRIVRWAGSFALAAAVSAVVGGCGKMQYQGTTVTGRTFHPDPGVEDVYVGADAEFAVTDPKEGRPSEVPQPSTDTQDAQSSQRDWEQVWNQAAAGPGDATETPAGEAEIDYVPVEPPAEQTDGSEPTLTPDSDRRLAD